MGGKEVPIIFAAETPAFPHCDKVTDVSREHTEGAVLLKTDL